MYPKLILDFLFWLHIGIIIFAISIGLFVPFPVALGLISLHRIHVFAFKGCLLSKLQTRLRGLPKDTDFLQHASSQLLGKNIKKKQSIRLDYSFVLLSITIAVLSSL